MTRTDEALVRNLAELTDRTLPPMALEPGAVLDAGRRHRRRRTLGGASAGFVAVAAAAVVTAQLGADPGPVTAPAAQTVELVDGLTATVPTSPTTVQTALGPGVDLGLPADDEHSYVVVANGHELEIRTLDGEGGMAGASSWDLGPSVSYPSFWMRTEGDASTVYGQGGPGIEVTLVSAPADGSAPLSIPVPTAQVEGFFGAMYLLRIDGAPAGGVWPDLSIRVRSADGTTTSQQIALPIEPPLVAATLEVAVATDWHVVDSSAGLVLELGLPVLTDAARQTADGPEDLTYILVGTTVGEMTGDPSLSAEDAANEAVTLAGMRPVGAVSPMTSTDLSTLGDSPVVVAGMSDGQDASDMDVLGTLPGDATAAALVVARDGGDERFELPTFTVPGLTGLHPFFFFTLHDEVSDVTSAPAHIELTAEDGSVTLWSVTGDLLYPAP